MLNRKEYPSKKSIDDGYIWASYNKSLLLGMLFPDNTQIFFDKIEAHDKETEESNKKEISFFKSFSQVVQFGISTGRYFTNNSLLAQERKIIGYDLSVSAISCIDKKGFEGRLINLDEIVTTGKHPQLAYYDKLKQDLSKPCALIMIRIAEYLNFDALVLLIFSCIDLAQPGSKFYFETAQSSVEQLGRNNFMPGYFASFFAPRTDMNICLRVKTKDEPQDRCEGEHTDVERLIVEKLMPL